MTTHGELLALADELEGHTHLSRPDRLKVAAALRLASRSEGVTHTPTSNSDVAEALTQACEYFEDRADVVDGDYGVPEPNKEMRLAQMCSDALDRLPAPQPGNPVHESDGGSMEQPFALADAARESPAPRASSGKQEGRTGSEVGAEQIAGSSMSYGPDKPIIAGQAPGPSEPSPSSRSETAGERALSQAEVRAGINILLETIAAKFDGWATWDVWRSEAASLVRSFKHAPPPSPDCSGCKPGGVQKETHATKQSLSGAEAPRTETAGGEG